MRPVTSHEWFCDGDDTLWWPGLSSLPMGFTWSTYFAQDINLEQVQLAGGIAPESLLTDASPPLVFLPDMSLAPYVYIDNVGVAHVRKREVQDTHDAVVSGMEDVGLEMHEVSM